MNRLTSAVDSGSEAFVFEKVKRMIAKHRDVVYVALSFLMIFVILINSLIFQSALIGACASLIYIVVNGDFLARAFFGEVKLRLPLGILLLIALLGIVGWVFMIVYRLTIIEVTMGLCIASFLSFMVTKYEGIKMIIEKRILGRR